MASGATRAAHAAALLALLLGGCGFGANVADDCLVERRAYEAAQRKREGFVMRGLGESDPSFEIASDGVRRARAALRQCEDLAG